jgi:hypothetical protein
MLGTFSGDGLGFGLAFTLKDQFTGPANKIQNGFNGLSIKAEEVTNKINSSFNNLWQGIGILGIGLSTLYPLGIGIKFASEFEATELAFSTLLGSAELAKDVLNEVDSIAVKTPFRLKEVEQSYKVMMAFGIGVQDLKQDFMALGNAAAATGGDINAIVRNYGQVKGIGKLLEKDRLNFIHQGIDITGLLSKVGVKIKEGVDIGAQNITFDKVRAAILKASEAGGRFHDLMLKLSTTVMGMVSNIRDNFDRLMRRVGQALEGATKPVLKKVLELIEKIELFSRTDIGKLTIKIIAFSMAAVASMYILAGLKIILTGLKNILFNIVLQILPFIKSMGILTLKLYVLYKLIDSGNPLLVSLGFALALAFGPLTTIAATVYIVIKAWNAFNEVLNRKGKLVASSIGFFEKLGGVLMSLYHIIKTVDEKSFMLPEKLYNKLKEMGILDLVKEIGYFAIVTKNFIEGLKLGLKQAFSIMKEAIMDVVKRFSPILEKFEFWNTLTKNNTDTLKKWKSYGVAAGYGIIGVLGIMIIYLTAVAIKMTYIAVASFVAFGWLPWIIIAVIALIGYVLYKFDKLYILLDVLRIPFDYLYISFKKFFYYLDKIIESFRSGDWLEGIKKIGQGILDFILTPFELVLNLLSKLPYVGWLFGDVLDGIKFYKDKLGLTFDKDEKEEERLKNLRKTENVLSPLKPGIREEYMNFSKNKLDYIDHRPRPEVNNPLSLQPMVANVYLNSSKIAEAFFSEQGKLNSRLNNSR